MQIVTYSGTMPCEGDRSFPVTLDFAIDANWQLDFLAAQFVPKLTQLKTLYIDNLANTLPVVVFIPNSGQQISVPAESQGWIALLVPNPPEINFSCAASIRVNIQLLNFDLPTYIWGGNISGPSGGGTNFRITQSGDLRETQSGDLRIVIP